MKTLAAFVACGWLGAVIAADAPRPALSSVYIEDLTWPEVKAAIAAGKTTAIIYAGSTEQNGPHLALGKHNFVAHYTAGEIAKKLGDALVYPTTPFAPTGSRELRTSHMRFAGSVSIDTETFQAVMRQVAQSALAAGFKNVFLMGDHGDEQDALRAAAKDLEDEYDKLDKTARVYYVPDLYYKEKQQMKAYLAERGPKAALRVARVGIAVHPSASTSVSSSVALYCATPQLQIFTSGRRGKHVRSLER